MQVLEEDLNKKHRSFQHLLILKSQEKHLIKKGDDLQLSVTGIYTTPDNETYKRDITDEVEIKGYDATQIGKQNVIVAYKEHDISLEKEIEVSVVEETVKKDETVTTPTTEDKVTNKINNYKKSQKKQQL